MQTIRSEGDVRPWSTESLFLKVLDRNSHVKHRGANAWKPLTIFALTIITFDRVLNTPVNHDEPFRYIRALIIKCYTFLEAGVLWKRCSENFAKSNENTCLEVSFFNKVTRRPATLLKKRLRHRCLPVTFAKFLRILFLRTFPGAASSHISYSIKWY